jgi:hypothetical protein
MVSAFYMTWMYNADMILWTGRSGGSQSASTA